MSAQFVSQTVRTATGHWPVILPALGIALQPNGKPQPCPTCGGKDRFRFDNQDGRGTWFCNQCGAGDGLNLVEKALSLSARAAAEQVAAVMGGNANALPPTAETGHASQKTGGQDKAEAQRKAARQALALVADAQSQTGNAYLSAKGWPEVDTLTLQGQSLRVGGITFQPGDLLLPLHNTGGEVVNVQLINAAGDKRMLAGGQVKAACHTLCGPDNAVIWLTEGYATGLTVHRLTGETVCVALSANNLAAVAEQLRSHYPDARLLLAADNDR
ncbi:DNA primase, partial [Serratia marcescens]